LWADLITLPTDSLIDWAKVTFAYDLVLFRIGIHRQAEEIDRDVPWGSISTPKEVTPEATIFFGH
jgi:hypothetical protein